MSLSICVFYLFMSLICCIQIHIFLYELFQWNRLIIQETLQLVTAIIIDHLLCFSVSSPRRYTHIQAIKSRSVPSRSLFHDPLKGVLHKSLSSLIISTGRIPIRSGTNTPAPKIIHATRYPYPQPLQFLRESNPSPDKHCFRHLKFNVSLHARLLRRPRISSTDSRYK